MADMVSELMADLLSLADCDARAGEPLGKCMRKAAAVLLSQRNRIAQLEEENAKLRTSLYVMHDYLGSSQ